MFNIPDHPDIESALRTGYPRSYGRPEPEYDEDWEYENRRDEALLAGLNPMTEEEREERRSFALKQIRELERRDHEAHK